MIYAFEQILTNHVIEGFKGEVGIDGATTITDESTEVMDFARLA